MNNQTTASKKHILVLGAGFGGLELSTILSETLSDAIEVTLIDQNDSFTFGFANFPVMFGYMTPEAVRLPYTKFVKPGVRLLKETITSIDPVAKRVITNCGAHEADYLVVALGADYDFDATPGLVDANEFYTTDGAARIGELLPTFSGGSVVVGACGAPFKCPPAPSEAALMMHDYLVKRGIRDTCNITLILPTEAPVPPSSDTSEALLDAFVEHNITFIGGNKVESIDAKQKLIAIDDGREFPYDLFLGVPVNCAPKVLVDSGMVENGFATVEPKTLKTRFPNVFAIGDCAKQTTPMAGDFAEGAARAVARALIASLQNRKEVEPHEGKGMCYLELGNGQVGRVDVDVFNPAGPTSIFHKPSAELHAARELYASSRRSRWFGL